MTYKTERTIVVGDITISVRTSDRTTMDLDVTTIGQVIVRGPHHTTDAQASDLARRRRRWIYQQLTCIADTRPNNPIKVLETGEEFPVLGQPHRLRVVPDTQQIEPALHHLDPGTRCCISMRHSTAEKLHKARQGLINFYAATGQEWLKIIDLQIAARSRNTGIPVSFSTRLRTTRARHHPTRGLTLHWATIQLDELLLHELIHRTLNLHTIADSHQLDHALRSLWLGDLTTAE
ncbi:YgjP-like metallopeptidase domain-containing protein [Streptomyces sp. 21So2-11]|uniref:YgjP-like metallopeptidase domain-containing protein n=1 Tax=Streptomyces sp. 21So2-11 TaxID=3144408 RepID=UPI00321B8141